MGLGIEAVREIKQEFRTEYWNKEYFNGIGISWVGTKKGESELVLRQGESLEDLCLYVMLAKEPPENVRALLPDEYKGVRVFYQVTGPIRAL